MRRAYSRDPHRDMSSPDIPPTGDLQTASRASQADVAMVQLHEQPFSRNTSKLWFAQLEAQFYLHRITLGTTRYYRFLSSQPSDVAHEVTDVNAQLLGDVHTTPLSATQAKDSGTHNANQARASPAAPYR